MKILLGWELGAGQGHIQRLTMLAQKLELHGYEPVFALKSYNLKGQEFKWQRVEAPRLPFSGRDASYTFADILATFGFDDTHLLKFHLQSWQNVLTAVQPSLIITDHAPGLVLAAYGSIPTVVIGSHFAVPPPVEEFPILRFPAPPESEQRQLQVSETVRQVKQIAPPLGKVLNGDRSFIFSLPQLDCYTPWRINPNYVGIHTTPLNFSDFGAMKSAWAYLDKNYDSRDLIIDTLKPNCEFKPLNEALSTASIAIHHGGLTTSIACLLAGVPQLLFPRHLEQQINARALVQLGVAKTVKDPTWETLHLAYADTFSLSEKAKFVAHELAQWNQSFVEQVINACLENPIK